MNSFFKFEETPKVGEFLLKVNFDNEEFLDMYTTGSYAVFPARVLGFSYPDYLRYCRDVCGARLIGKNTKYPVAHFVKNEKSMLLLKILNKQMKNIVDLKKLPKEEQQNFLAEVK